MYDCTVVEQTGAPFHGRNLEKLKALLAKHELTYDEHITYSYALLNEEYEWIGAGSLDGNILKCIVVDEAYQGMGLLAKIMTNLTAHAFEQGYRHLMLFTKPKNLIMFRDFSFYPIAQTEHVLLMENQKNGIDRFVAQIAQEEREDAQVGCIVMNCNPFTNGHKYLIEQAAAQCGLLYIFVVSSDRSYFPAEDRLRLVKEGVGGLAHVVICQTNDYLVSPATFPAYFIKEKAKVEEINCALDLQIFLEHFVKPLHIQKRFVGTEPNCKVTNAYNQVMKRILPQNGVEVVEIERLTCGKEAISASKVRELLEKGQYEQIKEIVPPSTYEYLVERK